MENNNPNYQRELAAIKKARVREWEAEKKAEDQELYDFFHAHFKKCKENNYVGLNSLLIQSLINNGYIKILARRRAGTYEILTIKNKWGAKATIQLSHGDVVGQW